MIRQSIFILAALALMAAAAPARAETNDHAVLQDKRGGVVYNSTGNCVRTQWENGGDPCAPQVAPVAAPTPMVAVPPPPPQPPVKHTIISEAARTVYFPFNKAGLTDEAKTQLDTLAQTLKAAKDIEAARVVGAADRIGSTKYNDKLSEKRAEGVRDYLIARGYANASVTHTKWIGKSQPITNCSKKLPHKKLVACLQNDRRVQIDIVYKSEVMTMSPKAPPSAHPAATTLVAPPAASSTPSTMPMPVR